MSYGKLSTLVSIAAAAVTLAPPAHADVDTDFANQLHIYGIYGQDHLSATGQRHRQGTTSSH
jgi:hypothetical protein